MEEFSLRDLRSSERSALLDEVAQSASVPFHARALDPGKPIEFTHRTRRLRDIELTSTVFNNYFGERTPSQARDHSEPRLVLGLSEGRVDIEQGEGLVRCTTRSIVPFWSLSPYKVAVAEQSSFWGFSLPIDELGLPHLLVRDLLSQDLSRSPLATLLHRHITSLAALPPMDAASESALASPSMDLVRAVLTIAVGDEFRSREPLGRTIGLRVIAYIRAHVTDSGLTADRIAAHFGISRRYLFTIMNQLGISMHEWIREERLIRAATMLGEPRNALISVAATGRMCGFDDHSSFSRAFRLRFGCAPSEWSHRSPGEQAVLRRRQSLSPDHVS